MSRVIRTIEEHNALSANDKVLIAVSGGADSVVLFDLFTKLKARYGLTLGAAHMDHGLRGLESETDRAFVERLAQNAGETCHSEYRDVKAFQRKHRLSLEDAARRVRYDFLFETADKHGFSKIATAHHGDDNAELVLMNLLRGSGPSGLSGMAVKSRHARLIRPFIGVSRQDIMAYVDEHGLAYREDASNTDTAILRNRIRHDLLPLLEANYHEGISRTLSRTAMVIRDDEDWLDTVVEPFYHKALSNHDERSVRFSIKVLEGHHVALRRRLIRKGIRHVKGDLKRIGFLHVDQVVGVMSKASGRLSLDLPGRIRVLKDGDHLDIVREDRNLREVAPFHHGKDVSGFAYLVETPLEPYMDVMIREAGVRFRFSPMDGPLPQGPETNDAKTAYLDMSRLAFPLVIRNTHPGDRFRPLGMNGHQRLSRFFTDHKIPAEHRKTVPVLVSGDDIVWVCGHRIDESAKILPVTEKILKIELFLA